MELSSMPRLSPAFSEILITYNLGVISKFTNLHGGVQGLKEGLTHK